MAAKCADGLNGQRKTGMHSLRSDAVGFFRDRLRLRAIGSCFGSSQGIRLHLFQLLFCGRRLLMPEVVIVVARAASHLRRLTIHQRNNGMIRHSAAFYAVIVNDVA